MSKRQRWLMRAAAAACALMTSAACWAGEPARYELNYLPAAGCPNRATFEQLVQTQLAEFGDAARTIPARAMVRFRQSAAGVVGRFELERQDGSRSSRELESGSCEEAATALAFVLALALGGRDTPLGAQPNAASQPVPETAGSAAPPAITADRGPELASVRPRAAWRWRFGGGAQLGTRSGVGPSWTLTEGGFLALRGEQRSPWGLRLRLAFLRGQPLTHAAGAGTTSFAWLAGRVEGCSWSAALFKKLTVTPCLATHFGQLTVAGKPRALPGAAGASAAKLWLEAGGALRLELQVAKSLSLEAQGEALLPLTRYRFAFDRPETPVYQVPSLAAGLFFGLAAHFP